ncbi:hypothetical protein RRG08_021940 [Elysia crispata]|uniref:Uncharacterized protein n=1 Tax=Elysia crispata TaxID=231223 RepID=A0AAE1ACQ9_9GAST|nr:hypothetical protein RRG08_021940 [Elysia crispata]
MVKVMLTPTPDEGHGRMSTEVPRLNGQISLWDPPWLLDIVRGTNERRREDPGVEGKRAVIVLGVNMFQFSHGAALGLQIATIAKSCRKIWEVYMNPCSKSTEPGLYKPPWTEQGQRRAYFMTSTPSPCGEDCATSSFARAQILVMPLCEGCGSSLCITMAISSSATI